MITRENAKKLLPIFKAYGEGRDAKTSAFWVGKI